MEKCWLLLIRHYVYRVECHVNVGIKCLWGEWNNASYSLSVFSLSRSLARLFSYSNSLNIILTIPNKEYTRRNAMTFIKCNDAWINYAIARVQYTLFFWCKPFWQILTSVHFLVGMPAKEEKFSFFLILLLLL